jgi:uncharacterized protein YndB with AHSA1/START domain
MRDSILATSAARGSVSLTRTVAAPPERVFEALIDPGLARQWFGVLSAPLVEEGRARLDFEDGDFFELDSIQLHRPTRVAYGWRFLGLGPRDAIEWHIARQDGWARVTVTDTDPLRASDWNSELCEGWKDFTSRLARYLATGENARYDWRRSLDGGAELECSENAARRLLSEELLPEWLPPGGAPAEAGTWEVGDGMDPPRVRVRRGPIAEGVSFDIDHPDWLASTRATLAVKPRGSCAMLTFCHNGWENLRGGAAYQKQQRRRFAALWVDTLFRARALAAPAAAGR